MENCPASSKENLPKISSQKKALVIDDDQGVNDLLCRVLNLSGFMVQSVFSCHDAKSLVQTNTFDLILLDINLPDGCGLDLITEIRSLYPNVIMITMTGDNPKWLEAKARKLHVAFHLVKPFDIKELMETFKNLAEKIKEI